MLQAVMTAPGEIIFEEVPTPEPEDDEVLVQMMRIGVCESDIHVYHGKHPFTSYPVVQGHEVSGRVAKIGKNVKGFEADDKVTIQPQVVCGQCLQCRTGKYHICDDLKVMGFQTTGAASDYFSVSAERVLKLPVSMSWEHGAMVEPLAVGVHALVVVSTTSGTGSQTTPVSVVTNSAERCKFALVDTRLFPRVGIVDPELVETLPPHPTASTGFDAFTHAFESYIHQNTSTHTDLCPLEVMRLVVEYLPRAIKDGFDKEARANLAWADTLAGSCIANAGTVLPHGIGMAIRGHAPHVRHGEALAVIYPEFMRYTYSSNTEKFATVAHLLDAKLDGKPDEFAAEASCDTMDGFLQNIGMYFTLKDLDVPEDELPAIADDLVKLPDYTVNPRVPDRDAIFGMLTTAYDR